MKSRAVCIRQTGGPEVLDLTEIDVPEPGPGEILLRQTAIGVNFIDIYHRSGTFPLPSLPVVLGVEGVGVVEAVGRHVDAFAAGDRVAYVGNTPGAYAARRVLPAARAFHVPTGVDDRTAAAVAFRGVTAHMLVRRSYAVTPGDFVLVHAAAGGVGSLLTQWASNLGAVVIGTVGSADKADVVRESGAAHVIVLRDADLAAEVARITNGEGVAAAYDGIGGATLLATLPCVRPFGTVVSFGQAGGELPPLDLSQLGPKRALTLARPGVFAYTARAETLRAAAAEVFALVGSGALRPHVGAAFALAEAAAAHAAVERGQTTGSTLLLP
jgi:NADPH2:quinone reductase